MEGSMIDGRYADIAIEYSKELLAIDSPTGMTAKAEGYVVEALSSMGFKVVHTNKGGVVADLGGEGPGLLFSAHIDTLGAMVCEIKGNGALRVTNIGGLNANNVETETCRVYTRSNGVLEGTFQLCNASIHVNKEYNDAKRTFSNVEVLLDCRTRSAEETKALGVCVGDYVCVEPRTVVTKEGFIKSRFLDDKLSAGMLLSYARFVKENDVKLRHHVYLYFTVYEEVGHGASSSIPDDVVEMVAVDMGCVGDGLNCRETQVSICAKDSGGPYNKAVVDSLVKAAVESGSDYAIDIYPFYGSDCGAMLESGCDVRHGLIGSGVYASHGYERSHRDGVLSTLSTIEAYERLN